MKKTFAAFVAAATIAGSLAATPASAQRGLAAGVVGGLIGGAIIGGADGAAVAREVVVALGPWSDLVFRPLGYSIPLGVKRGYHMHYRAKGNAVLNRPVLDTDNGYVLAPMRKGIRLTTGAEFARRDAPKTPVQLDKVEPFARRVSPLADRVDAEPWLGARPCLPDMLPAIGPIPGNSGLWADAHSRRCR